MKLLLAFLWLFFLISAFNSANNLFYLVFALFTAFFAAPAVIARRAGVGLGVKLTPPAAVFAGSAETVAAEITNAGGAEKFMLEFAPADEELYSFSRARLPYLGPAGVRTVPLDFHFKKRGLAIVRPLSVKSNIPLLLKEKYITVGAERHMIVFPEVAAVRFAAHGSAGNSAAKKRVFNSDYGELSKFKDYGAGDSPSKINWRHYSVTKTLIVPQNQDQIRVENSVLLLLAGDHASGSPSYELAVSAAASIIKSLHDRRLSFKLISVSDKVKVIDSRSAPIEKILAHLALLDRNRTISGARLARAAKNAVNSASVYAVSSQRFEGLNFLHRFLGDRLRKIIIASGDASEGAAKAGGKLVEITSLKNLSETAL